MKKTCKNGHVFFKTSDCPTCPKCEAMKKPKDGFLSLLAAPARRALENAKVDSLKILSTFTETELLKLHSLGPSSIPILKKCLKAEGLSFKVLKEDEVENYISKFPKSTQIILKNLRKLILEYHQEIVESMSYGMPAYKFKKKPLMYFAAYDHHIGIYATPNAHEAFKKELKNYKQGKGSVQFPLNEEIPFGLIEKMLEFNIKKISI